MPQRQQQNRAAGYIVSPSRLVTFLYVVLFVVVIALGSTFVARKRGRLARLAARQERITHSKETGEFKDALLTIGMALQSELRHFHVGAHLSDGLKSRVLDQMGQLDLALRNTTEESLAATDAELKAAAGDKPVKVDALGQVRATRFHLALFVHNLCSAAPCFRLRTIATYCVCSAACGWRATRPDQGKGGAVGIEDWTGYRTIPGVAAETARKSAAGPCGNFPNPELEEPLPNHSTVRREWRLQTHAPPTAEARQRRSQARQEITSR